jgi:hypothetical protein
VPGEGLQIPKLSPTKRQTKSHDTVQTNTAWMGRRSLEAINLLIQREITMKDSQMPAHLTVLNSDVEDICVIIHGSRAQTRTLSRT